MKKIGNVVIKNQVILNLIQDLQRWLLQLKNNVRGRFQIKFGMTSLCNNGGHRGFTLIELLVVILIIGILAAVALPQYKKAILKSRVTEYEVNLKALAEAHQVYYLANGKNASNISTLDIEIPKCKGIPGKFSECSYEIFGSSLQGYFIMLTAGSSPVLGYSLPGIINWNGVTKSDILVCVAYGKLSTSDCHSLGYTEQIGPSPVYTKP